MTSLLLNIEANTASFKSELSNATSAVNGFKSNLTRIAGVAGIAFGGKEVLNFGLEVSKLAGEFAGVENSFKKINGSTKLMLDMKEATKGTVSELNLMKRAVQFQNFGLSLQQLPKLLQFATARAQQTGQSVDYLVDSIVTGLGRKSVLILDNLGISSSQLNAEIAKTGDFVGAVGTIVDKELTKIGEIQENNLTKTERLSASWENFKVRLGDAANGTGVLGKSLDYISGQLDLLSSKDLSFLDKLGAVFGGSMGIVNAIVKDTVAKSKTLTEEQKKQEQVIREVNRAYVEFNGNIEAYSKAISTHVLKVQLLEEFQKRLNAVEAEKASKIENIVNLTAKLNELTERKQLLTGRELANTNKEIQAIENKIKALNELGVEEQKAQYFFDQKKKTKPKIEGLAPEIGDIQIREGVDSEMIRENTQETLMLASAWDRVSESLHAALGESSYAAIEGMGQAIVGMTDQAATSFQSFALGAISAIEGVIRTLWIQAVVGMLAGESSKGVIGLFAAGVGIAAMKALLQQSMKVPAYANGGSYGGGLALVGEMGPELINFNKGGQVYNHRQTKDILSGSRNNGRGIVADVKIKGEDLYLVLKEVERRRK